MSNASRGAAFLLLSALSCAAHAETRAAVLRPGEILANPGRYVGQTVEVEIVEPLSDFPTLEALRAAEYGEVEVRLPEPTGPTLSLVPGAFRPDDPGRYHNKFDRLIGSPVRVRGEFLSDDEMTRELHRPVYVIRVTSIDPLTPPLPAVLHSLADVAADPAHWDRRYVVYAGTYRNSFEISALDRDVWLDTTRATTVIGNPAAATGPDGARVRVTGYLFAKPAARYGHLGGYRYELLASKVEYVGAEPPAPKAPH